MPMPHRRRRSCFTAVDTHASVPSTTHVALSRCNIGGVLQLLERMSYVEVAQAHTLCFVRLGRATTVAAHVSHTVGAYLKLASTRHVCRRSPAIQPLPSGSNSPKAARTCTTIIIQQQQQQ